MKKIYLLLLAAIIILVISVSAFLHSNYPTHSTSFIYAVTATTITVETTYDPAQAPQVASYMDSCLLPQVIFGQDVKVNKEVITFNNSKLHYHIKGAPGSLTIIAPKTGNDSLAIRKLKSIFEGLKSVIKPT